MKNNIKVALISQEKIGKNMAGSAIRYFELAKILSSHFKVTLFSTGQSDLDGNSLGFDMKSYVKSARRSEKSIKNVSDYDYVIAQELSPDLLIEIKQKKVRLISDLYDPLPIEIVEHTKNYGFSKRLTIRGFINNSFLMQIVASDHILCSSNRQKLLYEDMSKKSGINISNKTITLLPFGLSDIDPIYTDREMIYDIFPSISKNDKIILWGGGIWNWFDPLSVVKAIEQISHTRDDIKLVFMGAKNKHFDALQDKSLQIVLEYCKKNQLENKFVFLNYNWVPYEQRVNFLLSSDICVSTHFDCKETYYSFRTRILDYLWAEKPIVCTEGDIFSELISKHKLGKIVRYSNVDDIKKAILELINDPDLYKKIEGNIENFKKTLTWEKVTEGLITLIQNDSIKYQRMDKRIFNMLKFKFFFWVGFKKIIKIIGYE